MYGTVVGVLRGGPSREHERSLLSGHAVVANLPRDKYTVRDIYIDHAGAWHERGKPSTPSDILRTIDVVISTLHGNYGENGEIQRLLEKFTIPYVGADALNSHLALHKVLSRERAKELGIKTPKYIVVDTTSDVEKATYDIIRNFAQPVNIRPVLSGSLVSEHSVGGYAHVAQTLATLLAQDGSALVEEKIRGTEANVTVVEGLRGEVLYVLPPVEIMPSAEEIIPGRFTKPVQDELSTMARTMHQALAQRHYSSSDFVIAKNGIYFLGLNNAVSSDLSKDARLAKSLASVGVPFPDFISHVLDRALITSRPLW